MHIVLFLLLMFSSIFGFEVSPDISATTPSGNILLTVNGEPPFIFFIQNGSEYGGFKLQNSTSATTTPFPSSNNQVEFHPSGVIGKAEITVISNETNFDAGRSVIFINNSGIPEIEISPPVLEEMKDVSIYYGVTHVATPPIAWSTEPELPLGGFSENIGGFPTTPYVTNNKSVFFKSYVEFNGNVVCTDATGRKTFAKLKVSDVSILDSFEVGNSQNKRNSSTSSGGCFVSE